MGHKFAEIAFTDTVKSIQSDMGSRKMYTRMEEGPEDYNNLLGPNEAAFISARDSLYMATVSETGWPYVQHRGGPQGLLKVIDESTLAFADFSGNRQYISLGNLSENNKAFIFLMDYANQRRIKIWGTGEVIEDDPALLERLADPEYAGSPERAIVFHLRAWDVNCPQHIPHLYTKAQIAAKLAELQNQVAALEAENQRLRGLQ